MTAPDEAPLQLVEDLVQRVEGAAPVVEPLVRRLHRIVPEGRVDDQAQQPVPGVDVVRGDAVRDALLGAPLAAQRRLLPGLRPHLLLGALQVVLDLLQVAFPELPVAPHLLQVPRQGLDVPGDDFVQVLEGLGAVLHGQRRPELEVGAVGGPLLRALLDVDVLVDLPVHPAVVVLHGQDDPVRPLGGRPEEALARFPVLEQPVCFRQADVLEQGVADGPLGELLPVPLLLGAQLLLLGDLPVVRVRAVVLLPEPPVLAVLLLVGRGLHEGDPPVLLEPELDLLGGVHVLNPGGDAVPRAHMVLQVVGDDVALDVEVGLLDEADEAGVELHEDALPPVGEAPDALHNRLDHQPPLEGHRDVPEQDLELLALVGLLPRGPDLPVRVPVLHRQVDQGGQLPLLCLGGGLLDVGGVRLQVQPVDVVRVFHGELPLLVLSLAGHLGALAHLLCERVRVLVALGVGPRDVQGVLVSLVIAVLGPVHHLQACGRVDEDLLRDRPLLLVVEGGVVEPAPGGAEASGTDDAEEGGDLPRPQPAHVVQGRGPPALLHDEVHVHPDLVHRGLEDLLDRPHPILFGEGGLVRVAVDGQEVLPPAAHGGEHGQGVDELAGQGHRPANVRDVVAHLVHGKRGGLPQLGDAVVGVHDLDVLRPLAELPGVVLYDVVGDLV